MPSITNSHFIHHRYPKKVNDRIFVVPNEKLPTEYYLKDVDKKSLFLELEHLFSNWFSEIATKYMSLRKMVNLVLFERCWANQMKS